MYLTPGGRPFSAEMMIDILGRISCQVPILLGQKYTLLLSRFQTLYSSSTAIMVSRCPLLFLAV
jgi:hypothetical protein